MRKQILTLWCAFLVSAALPIFGRLQSQERACPVTVPNGRQPPDRDFGGTTNSAQQNRDASHLSTDSHGVGKLWVVLPPEGIARTDRTADGTLRWKFPWYRGVPGKLEIKGHRLDGPDEPLRIEIPSGYGNTGLQASSVSFPSEGCWEITGKVKNQKLTFVMKIQVAK